MERKQTRNKYRIKLNGKNDTGRPTVMTPGTIAKLEQAFSIGASDGEACVYADIDESALYRYCNAHPEFRERKEQLKKKPILKARDAVVRGLDDPELALKFLERKCKDEFSLRVEQQVEAAPVKIICDL